MMKKFTLLFFVSILLMQFSAKAQYDFSKIEYWVGSGTDSCALVLDFHDGSSDSCYVWGVLFTGSTTGEAMLNAVAAADINFTTSISSGFLSDIVYGNHSGLGGNPEYWMTYTGTDISNLSMNMGIGSTIQNKDIFGCNYSPVDGTYMPLLSIGNPIPAYEPLTFTIADVEYFIGSGQDTAMLVIDFQDGSGAFAWGYLFDGTATGNDMLTAVANADANLSAAIAGGFLNDINYYNHNGIGGSPNYWSTWSATNLGNWSMNMGLTTSIANGDIFGCSYTDFNPALRPNNLSAAPNTTSIAHVEQNISINAFPNPTTDVLNIQSDVEIERIVVLSANGSMLINKLVQNTTEQINLETLSNGVYFLQIFTEGKVSTQKVVKK